MLMPRVDRVSSDTVQPPDRVGVVRKLRLGVTLKKEGTSYTLDMTTARYKTSRFYGPSITSMSALLKEPLDAYLSSFVFETAGNETPCAPPSPLVNLCRSLLADCLHGSRLSFLRFVSPHRRYDALPAFIAMVGGCEGVLQEALAWARGAPT